MDVSTLLQEVEAKRQNAWRSYLFCGLMGIAPVAMFLLQKTSAALVLSALWILYYLLLTRPDRKKYAAAFLRGNLLASLSSSLEGVAYHGKTGLPREELLAEKLLPIREGNSFMTFHCTSGTSRRLEVTLSDVSFQLDAPDEKGRPQFFSGCWAQIKLDRPTGLRLRLVTADLAVPSLLTPWFEEKAGLSPLSLEPHRAARVFTAWGEKNSPGLTQSALGHLMDLREKKDLPLAIGLEEDHLAVFFPRRFLSAGEPSLRAPVTEAALLRSPLPELEELLKAAVACARAAAPESV